MFCAYQIGAQLQALHLWEGQERLWNHDKNELAAQTCCSIWTGAQLQTRHLWVAKIGKDAVNKIRAGQEVVWCRCCAVTPPVNQDMSLGILQSADQAAPGWRHLPSSQLAFERLRRIHVATLAGEQRSLQLCVTDGTLCVWNSSL